MRWQDKLTKKELRHLRIDANCRTLSAVKRTVEQHEIWRHEIHENNKRNVEPCWECKAIGRKLGLIK